MKYATIAVTLWFAVTFRATIRLFSRRWETASSSGHLHACDLIDTVHYDLLRAVERSRDVHAVEFLPERNARNPPRLSTRTSVERLRARFAATRLHLAVDKCMSSRGPRAVDRKLTKAKREAHAANLEFSGIAIYPIEGVLLYVMSAVGISNFHCLEIDGAPGTGILLGCAAFAVYDGWAATCMYPMWTGYATAQDFFEGSGDNGAHKWRKQHHAERAVDVTEEQIHPVSVDATLQRANVGETADILILAADGHDLDVWLNMTVTKPRVVVVFYQDYWGAQQMAHRSMSGVEDIDTFGAQHDGVYRGRKRLFVGSSLQVFVAVAKKLEYRLVWCTSSIPAAIFTLDNGPVSSRLLPGTSTDECMLRRQGVSRTWRRDMEAQWHIAQQFEWQHDIEL